MRLYDKNVSFWLDSKIYEEFKELLAQDEMNVSEVLRSWVREELWLRGVEVENREGVSLKELVE